MQEQSYKYWAFISYSHRDRAWAEWLHRALETYRVPRRLVGREAPAGPVPRRLFPIFRDQEELPSSPNLSAAIDQALEQSRCLIVIASPYAAVSKWVDQEIARFRALGRDGRIFCLIVDGEPHADLQPGKGLLECFPPSLRSGDGIEPIAADVRSTKDGKPAARLKLIAGLLGVGLDDLRRREQRRRLVQRLSRAVVGLLFAAALAGVWQAQQRDKRQALAQQALKEHINAAYERGRQELLAHNEARAAVYLGEAYRLGADTPALRFMLARAMRVVDMEKHAFEAGSPVSEVRFSPDSQLLISRSAGEAVGVWDVGTGKKISQFLLPPNAEHFGPGFSRNNQMIYFGGVADGAAKGFLHIWSALDGRALAELDMPPNAYHPFNLFDLAGHRIAHATPDHGVEIYDLDSRRVLKHLQGDYTLAGYSRDGSHLLTGGEQGEVAIWDRDGTRKALSFHDLHTAIVAIDDTFDGSLIAAAGQDGAVRVWRTDDAALQLVAGHPSANPGLVFDVDGGRLLTKANDGARVWDTASGALVYVKQFAGAPGNRVSISSGGKWIMTTNSGRLVLEDAQSGVELFSLDAHRGLPLARDITEDDKMLVTGGPDGRIVLWDATLIPQPELRHLVDPLRWASAARPPGVAAVFSHSGALIATGAGDGQLKVWDAKTHALLRSIAADERAVNVVSFAADDASIATGGEVGGVKVWDTNSGRLLHALDCDGKRVLTLAFTRDGRTLAAAIRGGTTRLWNLEGDGLIAAFQRDEARAGAFSPSGRYFAVGIHGAVKLWEIDRRGFVWTTALREASGDAVDDLSGISFSADGSRIVASTYGRAAFLLSAGDGQPLRTMSEPSASRINSVDFDADGRRVVMGDDNGTAILWRLDNGTTRVLRGHAGQVRSAGFSPNQDFIMTTGVDGTGRIWDPDSGELLDVIAQHGSQMPEVPFQAMSVSADSEWLLTGTIDGVIRMWRLGQEQRSPQEIESILRCDVPWRVEGESLAPSTPNDHCLKQ